MPTANIAVAPSQPHRRCKYDRHVSKMTGECHLFAGADATENSPPQRLDLLNLYKKYKNPHPPERAGALFVICGCGYGARAVCCPDTADTCGLGGSHHLATGIHTQSDVASTIGYSSRIRTLRPMPLCAPLGARSIRPAVPVAV